MRRVVWSVLTGLGVFFIVVALLSKFFIPGQAVKFPLNEFTKTTLQASNASYFSPRFISEETGVTLQATNTTLGDVAAAKLTNNSSHVAVWHLYSAIEDTTNHLAVAIPAGGNTFAFDRKTGAVVSCTCNAVNGKHVDIPSGVQGPLFPLGTKKHTYKVYDTTLKRPVPFHYKGVTATDGVATYIFTAVVFPTQIGNQTLPGSLVGMTQSEVTLPEFYSANDTMFVDPVTGVPLAVDENVRQTLQDSTGTTRLVLLSGNFQTTPESVAKAVSRDNGGATAISLLKVTVPIVGGLLGIILLGAGLILSRRPEDEEYEEDEETVGAAV